MKSPITRASAPLASEHVIDPSQQDYRLALNGSVLHVLAVKLTGAQDATHTEHPAEQNGADHHQ